MNIRIPAILLLICSLLLSGCNKETVTAETAATDDAAALEIGISFDSFLIERWIRDRDVFVSTAKSLGADVNVQNSNGDLQEQIDQIEYFIKKQVDVIVVVAGDCNKLDSVMKKAKDAGIKTMCYDRLIQNADCDMFISFNNEKVGILMAESLIESIPEGGDIFMIQGSPTDQNVDEVRNGFFKTLEGSNLNVVHKESCTGWLAEPAFYYVKEGLSDHRDVKGIMCGNDDIATQVFRALSEEQLAGTVILVGQDGDLIACQRIVEGTQQMTAFKSVTEQARLAAELAVKLGRGESLEDVNKTMFDGTYDVPYVELDPIAVTKENMDEVIIQGGFHAQEDVYLNSQ